MVLLRCSKLFFLWQPLSSIVELSFIGCSIVFISTSPFFFNFPFKIFSLLSSYLRRKFILTSLNSLCLFFLIRGIFASSGWKQNISSTLPSLSDYLSWNVIVSFFFNFQFLPGALFIAKKKYIQILQSFFAIFVLVFCVEGKKLGNMSTSNNIPFALNTTISDPTSGIRFQLISVLGTGTYAVVYRAKDLNTGALYALKCISKDSLSQKECDLQLKEVEIHASLPRHPNVVYFHRSFQNSQWLFLVQEYIEGQDLYFWIADQFYNPVPLLSRIAPIRDIFVQILSAVSFIHSRDISHRDLKPENFIITPNQGVKLTDFGLASMSVALCTSFKTGSRPYMSPECRCPDAPFYDPFKSDVWSLGIVLLNMIFFQNPWDDPDPRDTNGKKETNFASYLQHPVGFLRAKFPGMPLDVARWLSARVFCPEASRASIGEFADWAEDLVNLFRSGSLSRLPSASPEKNQRSRQSKPSQALSISPRCDSGFGADIDLEGTTTKSSASLTGGSTISGTIGSRPKQSDLQAKPSSIRRQPCCSFAVYRPPPLKAAMAAPVASLGKHQNDSSLNLSHFRRRDLDSPWRNQRQQQNPNQKQEQQPQKNSIAFRRRIAVVGDGMMAPFRRLAQPNFVSAVDTRQQLCSISGPGERESEEESDDADVGDGTASASTSTSTLVAFSLPEVQPKADFEKSLGHEAEKSGLVAAAPAPVPRPPSAGEEKEGRDAGLRSPRQRQLRQPSVSSLSLVLTQSLGLKLLSSKNERKTNLSGSSSSFSSSGITTTRALDRPWRQPRQSLADSNKGDREHDPRTSNVSHDRHRFNQRIGSPDLSEEKGKHHQWHEENASSPPFTPSLPLSENKGRGGGGSGFGFGFGFRFAPNGAGRGGRGKKLFRDADCDRDVCLDVGIVDRRHDKEKDDSCSSRKKDHDSVMSASSWWRKSPSLAPPPLPRSHRRKGIGLPPSSSSSLISPSLSPPVSLMAAAYHSHTRSSHFSFFF